MGIETVETVPVLLADGKRIAPAMADGRLCFQLPVGCGSAVVGGFVPTEVDPRSTDRRRRGLAIAAITVAGAELPVETAIEVAALPPPTSGRCGDLDEG